MPTMGGGMDKAFARRMSELTSEFYERAAPSFSATRQAPWQGWHRLLGFVPAGSDDPPRVLDVACGNLRFERFLREQGVLADVWAYDNSDELVAAGAPGARFCHLDVAEALLGGEPLRLQAPPCDLAVSFGFMHHLPLFEQRAALLQTLVDHVRPGGHVCVTFWQFADDARLRAKAWPAPGGSSDDYLLGWQGRTDVARFCHHASEAEIDALVASVAGDATELSRFSADGKTGDLNRYVVLRVR